MADHRPIRLPKQWSRHVKAGVLLREELSIKDARWERSRSRRRPHYLPTQRMRILQLRAARGWTLQKTACVFLIDLQTLLIWMRRLDEEGERPLIQTVEPVNRPGSVCGPNTKAATIRATTEMASPTSTLRKQWRQIQTRSELHRGPQASAGHRTAPRCLSDRLISCAVLRGVSVLGSRR